ncbi:MAG: hypothetical protein COA54_05605 [Thiotrichaceae bacterium]|nr:MAG: hypothetical protein COA54_05605 [Thiotrichaceae bacterium]
MKGNNLTHDFSNFVQQIYWMMRVMFEQWHDDTIQISSRITAAGNYHNPGNNSPSQPFSLCSLVPFENEEA